MNHTELKHIKAIYSNPLSWIHHDKRPRDPLPASATCRGIINSWLAATYDINACHEAPDLTAFEKQLFRHWEALPVIFSCMAAQRNRRYLLQTDYRTIPGVVTSFMKLSTGIISAEKQHLASRLTLDDLTYSEVLSLKRVIPEEQVNMITLLFAKRQNACLLPDVEFNMQLFILAQQHVIKQR
ncbi:hypothetical protein DBY66_014315 [Pantoea sp. RIT413]|uniref:hypothetical protein n=1 Tax=Pantoea sp. RIT413 TaxID=2202162 RepID=UPI000D35608F|nr:hypothetical protein [Pantoea sp. RIT 413]RAU29971.1 hypothetical protein DBY66_014315 [Pantoea sp. RIT 413]